MIILSGLTQRRSELAGRFLESGAVDVIWKSVSMMDIDGIANTIIEKVLFWGHPVKVSDLPEPEEPDISPYDVVMLTFGDGRAYALMHTLCELPPTMPPVVVAAQAPTACINGLVRVIGRMTGRRVVAASEDRPLEPGQIVLVAGATRYQLVQNGDTFALGKTTAVLTHGAIFDPLYRGFVRAGRNVLCIALSGTSVDWKHAEPPHPERTQLLVQTPQTCTDPDGCRSLIDTVDFAQPVGFATLRKALRFRS
ncbi:chemotaxis protein CheB [Breoghania sp.]|uniref:chemotaxis protein CheB n=1 Tax=Breoghania sp. TaxID=2065378 RepID=UPI00262980AE|nr:chemotaxis protein CheB [Breoghania sp.]MDJ0933326.1 chemotaxis protein CheB [Breoghania sp.]